MRHLSWFLLLASLGFNTPCQAQEAIVFAAGEAGYANFRIPAIIQTPKHFVAFAEGRKNHAGDFGNIDIVFKTSKDGKVWGPLQVAVDANDTQAGNPAPVLDTQDPRFPMGRIFLFYNTGNNHEQEVRMGNGLRECWYITSTDGAQSWSKPVNITLQVHRPNQPSINQAYSFAEDWRTYANTPGHAIQLQTGPYAGRIYVAANHSVGTPKVKNTDWTAHGYFTDDHGETFNLSANIPFEGSNESMAAEIGPNTLFMTIRNQRMRPRQRIIARSRDGGATWFSAAPNRDLPDPVCQGSVLSWKKASKFVLAHANPADSLHRNNLTLRVSKNGGKNWHFTKLIASAPPNFKGDYSAYSDLVFISNQKIGVLFEKEHYSKIVFTIVEWK